MIAIAGSGELLKSLRPLHQALFSALATIRPVFLDVPAAFQQNVDQLGERAKSYFRDSFDLEIAVLSWRDYLEPATRGRFLAALRQANYVLAGPGSPSFALRALRATEIPAILQQILNDGGCLMFASAAAITLGAFALPVYEIFKVGEELHWMEGLDLLAHASLRVAVVPHYNNSEGKDFDTRFCYLGQNRFSTMEQLLPPDVRILGVDEHTGCIIDERQGIMTVMGHGVVTIGRGAQKIVVPAGKRLDLREVAWSGRRDEGEQTESRTRQDLTAKAGHKERPYQFASDPHEDVGHLTQMGLGALADQGARAVAAYGSVRTDALVEQTLLHLSNLAQAAAESEQSLVTLIEELVEIRGQLRGSLEWSCADQIRGALRRIGIELQDGPSDSTWAWGKGSVGDDTSRR